MRLVKEITQIYLICVGIFLIEIDFTRKTASGTNGVNQAMPDKSPQLKKAPGEYKSVTGDFLEEVVSLINLKGTDGSSQPAHK